MSFTVDADVTIKVTFAVEGFVFGHYYSLQQCFLLEMSVVAIDDVAAETIAFLTTKLPSLLPLLLLLLPAAKPLMLLMV